MVPRLHALCPFGQGAFFDGSGRRRDGKTAGYADSGAAGDTLRLSRRRAVQHRGAVHQGYPLARHEHQQRQEHGLPAGDRGLPAPQPPRPPLQPVDRPGGGERMRHQRALLPGQQADHRRQHHRPAVYRPDLRDPAGRRLLAEKAGAAGPDRLRPGAGGGGVLLRGQPGDGRDAGEPLGSALGPQLRRGVPPQRPARRGPHLLGVLGGSRQRDPGPALSCTGDSLYTDGHHQRSDPGGLPGGAGLRAYVHRPSHHPGSHRQPHLRHRACSQPHSGGRILRRGGGGSGPGGGGDRGGLRSGI